MKWVFASNQESLQNPREDWQRLIRAAVQSARVNTTLEPFMIYDGDDNPFVDELRAFGVTILRHKLSFYGSVLEYQQENKPHDLHYLQTATSAFLRVDIPLLFKDDDFVLYTDCDVMFLKEPCVESLRPAFFACAPERKRGDSQHINTGVMVMNIKALREDHPSFCRFIQRNYSELVSFDQGAYIAYYDGKNQLLPDELNWKPYWGMAGDPQIVHFHGPKPRTALAILTNPRFQTSPLISEIFHQAPRAYEHFLSIWNKFLDREVATRDELENGRAWSERSYSDAADSTDFLRHLAKLNERIASPGEKIEGNVCYLDQISVDEVLVSLPTMEPNHIKKRRNLGAVARQSTMMLEVGLNGGHSALLCLLSNPNLVFVGIDIFEHKYTEHAAAYLKETFPRRFHCIRGDSREVLPRMAIEKPNLLFDAIHIDGGHTEGVVYADVSNVLRLARHEALLVFDDLQSGRLARIFENCLLLGYFRPLFGKELVRNDLQEVVRVR
jgi:methyltransferase family protein